MAVTQISKIQVRRGFQSDIGNLAAGEFAWAIDSQRLFIGNGTTEEGAPISGITEIMTNNFTTTGGVNEIITNYVYKGVLGGYEVITGIDTSTPVVRALQDKIDDIVNVRDFGASGTGNVDDTMAIQRAIFELYDRFDPGPDVKTRRKLRFNAGTYLIEGELLLPPFLSIEGEGIDNVQLLIKQPIKFVTSSGSDPVEIVIPSIYPTGINIKGLTVTSTESIVLLDIDGSNNVTFEDCAFVGPKTMPDNNSFLSQAMRISSSAKITSRIMFNRCVFKKFDRAATIDSQIGTEDISFTNCFFNECGRGIVTETIPNETEEDQNIPVSGLRISNSMFLDIYGHGIYGDDYVRGIASISNTFKNVGSFYEGDETSISVWGPIIVFNANDNYSIADMFHRTVLNSKSFRRIQATNYRIVSFSIDEYLALGSAKNIAGARYTLLRNQGFSLPLETAIETGIVNYTMQRGPEYRSGILKFARRSEDEIVYDEEYTETADVGVEVSIISNPTDTLQLRIAGITDNSIDDDVIFCYDLKTLS